MIKPLGSRLIVKTDTVEEKTTSGLFVPLSENEKDKKDIGTVTEIGPDVREVKVGDRILFKKWGVEVVEVEKEKLNFVEESDVLAILE